MKNLLIFLFIVACSLDAYSFPKGETPAERIMATWRIKNVQKMQGLVVRSEKYTKDGGDAKAYIKRFKGAIITFKEDSTAILVTPYGKRKLGYFSSLLINNYLLFI